MFNEPATIDVTANDLDVLIGHTNVTADYEVHFTYTLSNNIDDIQLNQYRNLIYIGDGRDTRCPLISIASKTNGQFAADPTSYVLQINYNQVVGLSQQTKPQHTLYLVPGQVLVFVLRTFSGVMYTYSAFKDMWPPRNFVSFWRFSE